MRLPKTCMVGIITILNSNKFSIFQIFQDYVKKKRKKEILKRFPDLLPYFYFLKMCCSIEKANMRKSKEHELRTKLYYVGYIIVLIR